MRYSHPHADPKYLVKQAEFYLATCANPEYTRHLHSVSEWALENKNPCAEKARSLCQGLSTLSPSAPYSSVKKFIQDEVITHITYRERHNDIFWCVLLSLLDSKGSLPFSLGGPVHRAVLQFHDDFHPQDVSIG